MLKIYFTNTMTLLDINNVIPNDYNFALFNLSMRENVPVSKHFSE